MTRTSFRRAAAPGIAVLTLGLGLTGCAAGNEEASTNSAATVEGASGTLNGAGSSAQEAAMAAWQAGFQTANPEVTVNYDPVGSGGGREQFIAGGVDVRRLRLLPRRRGGRAQRGQEALPRRGPDRGPELRQPDRRRLQPRGRRRPSALRPVIAEIFDGKITKWNDPKIAAENPDADLPAETITPVHRADDSGTTDNFTDYLSQAGEGAWPHEPEGVWPTKGGEAASGTSGLVAAVKNGTGTIGYADASQAGDLGIASVKVGEEYVAADPRGRGQGPRGLAPPSRAAPRSTWPSSSTARPRRPAPTRSCSRRT